MVYDEVSYTLEFRLILYGRNRLGTRNELRHSIEFSTREDLNRFIMKLQEEREYLKENLGVYSQLFNAYTMVTREYVNGREIVKRETTFMYPDIYNRESKDTLSIDRAEVGLNRTWDEIAQENPHLILGGSHAKLNWGNTNEHRGGMY